MQNIKISISFHSTTHNHENAKHMQTQNTGERNKVLGERNGEKKKKKEPGFNVFLFNKANV